MRITPLDARKQEFGKAMRGYDCDEVQAFLTTLADEYEAVLVDNKEIRERIMEQDEKLTEYQSMERNLRDTLMTAERVMQETKENASKKGDLILQDAEMKARNVLEECRMRTEELRREIQALRKEKETYLARFKSLAEAQIQFVETHKNDFEDLDRRLVDIVDSVVAGASAAETKPSPQATAPRVAPTKVAPVNDMMPEPVSGPDPFAAPQTPADMPAAAAPNADQGPSHSSSGQDIWRDYTPGGAPAPDAPAAHENTEAGAIADIVSESLAETGESAQDRNEPDNQKNETEWNEKPDSGANAGDGVSAPTPEVILDAAPVQDDAEGDPVAEETPEEKPASIW